MRYFISLLFFLQVHSASITEFDWTYRDLCRMAVSDPFYFQRFRSLSDYSHVLELIGGEPFAKYLVDFASKETLEKMGEFRKLDELGGPNRRNFPIIGEFSGTTLRYIVIADQIKKLFALSLNAKIVEIGGGFGGQCFIYSRLQPFSKYYIYDLPEPEALTEKVMEHLGIKNVQCLPMDLQLPEERVDLFISNYAYSECDRSTQLDYFERVIKKADRGYLIYNLISTIHGVKSLTSKEFIELLEENGIHPLIFEESIETDPNNLLIIWDRT